MVLEGTRTLRCARLPGGRARFADAAATVECRRILNAAVFIAKITAPVGATLAARRARLSEFGQRQAKPTLRLAEIRAATNAPGTTRLPALRKGAADAAIAELKERAFANVTRSHANGGFCRPRARLAGNTLARDVALGPLRRTRFTAITLASDAGGVRAARACIRTARDSIHAARASIRAALTAIRSACPGLATLTGVEASRASAACSSIRFISPLAADPRLAARVPGTCLPTGAGVSGTSERAVPGCPSSPAAPGASAPFSCLDASGVAARGRAARRATVIVPIIVRAHAGKTGAERRQ